MEDTELELYESVDALPVDTPEGVDGDDSVLGPEGMPAPLEDPRTAVRQAPKRKRRRALFVPRKRVVRLGTVGHDAVAVKRALQKLGYLAPPRKGGKPTRFFGPLAVRALKKAQKAAGIPASGLYGRGTHHSFLKRKAFDAYGAWLMANVQLKTPEQKKREGIRAAALFGAARQADIHYTQGPLRMYGVRNRVRIPRIPYFEDCSSFATWCYWHPGVADPNGRDYDGYGFTGTLQTRGRRVSVPQIGDLIFYGPGGNSHVTVYIGDGKCVSHGNEYGPRVLHWRYRPDVHSVRSYI